VNIKSFNAPSQSFRHQACTQTPNKYLQSSVFVRVLLNVIITISGQPRKRQRPRMLRRRHRR